MAWSASAEAIRDAGPEALDTDVRSADQPLRDAAVVLPLQVEHDAALAPLEDGVRRVPPARAARRVDAHHVCAQVAEQHRRRRLGQIVAQVDDPEAGELARRI